MDSLPFSWDHLEEGGFIYFDEYYSLKYPGLRYAVNEFCNDRNIHPERVMACSLPEEFERWFIRKPKSELPQKIYFLKLLKLINFSKKYLQKKTWKYQVFLFIKINNFIKI